MDLEEFRRAGLALYGRSFASGLAADLDIAPRTISRMMSGKINIPPALRPLIMDIMRERGPEIARLLKEMEGPIDELLIGV
jgi:hypothetical protein